MKKVVKWIAIVLAGLIGLVVVAVIGMYVISGGRINKSYNVQPAAVTVPTDAGAIAEGKRLFTTRGCADCHGADAAGTIMEDDPALGRLVASNLTAGQGGVGGSYTDADWVRAIRHGIGPDGKSLFVMPSNEFYTIDDNDLGALIAYIKSAPAVDNVLPESTAGPIARALIVTGAFPLLPAEIIDHDAPRPAPVAKTASVEFGAYLAQTCVGCHGAGLSGGPMPGVPAEPPFPANLTPDPATGLGQWQEVDFVRAMREGKRPDGSIIDPKAMPWPALGQMTDVEMSALWLYLHSLPAKPEGSR